MISALLFLALLMPKKFVSCVSAGGGNLNPLGALNLSDSSSTFTAGASVVVDDDVVVVLDDDDDVASLAIL